MEDHRTKTERDCDRITYSDAFRRLGGVTQVVAVGEMPLFHTRLTHTLKVAQLARRISEHILREEQFQDILHEIGGLDSSAAEAAGLAHDLGHPPFGHVGESALDRQCARYGLDGYEGNAQTFRILAKLERYGTSQAGYGLALGQRTMLAVIKYPWLRKGPHAGARKWNAYPTEEDIFNKVREGLSHNGRSIEAAIMDWADDITYAIHDLEDFIRCGCIPVAQLRYDKVEMADFTSTAAGRLAEKEAGFDPASAVKAFEEILKTFPVQRYSGADEELRTLRDAAGVQINRYVSAVKVKTGDEPLDIPTEMQYEVKMLMQLTWHYMIDRPALASLQKGQMAIVTNVFDRLMEILEKDERKPETLQRLPARLRNLAALTREEPTENYRSEEARRARAVADYIASLTEDQATDLFTRLNGGAQRSVLDPWLAY
jgi:dGTPase